MKALSGPDDGLLINSSFCNATHMARLPAILAARYRPATDREVRLRSFGLLRAPRNPQADDWEQLRGTLEDQGIFGSLRDFECTCGKYKGQNYRGMICDRCGVKLTAQAVRRQRFGHIELPLSIPHPLGDTGEKLSAVPVLPASFWEAPAGTILAQAYDDLARTASSGVCKALAEGNTGLPDWAADQAKEKVAGQLGRLVDLLLPVATIAHEWNLHEAVTLAWGLALEQRATLANLTCSSCGYPLEGLDVLVCPGCGAKFRQGS